MLWLSVVVGFAFLAALVVVLVVIRSGSAGDPAARYRHSDFSDIFVATDSAPTRGSTDVPRIRHHHLLCRRPGCGTGLVHRTAGALMFWHVDDPSATLEQLLAMGATEYEPLTTRASGFTTASVIDPFGNILGVRHNPHYLEVLARRNAL